MTLTPITTVDEFFDACKAAGLQFEARPEQPELLRQVSSSSLRICPVCALANARVGHENWYTCAFTAAGITGIYSSIVLPIMDAADTISEKPDLRKRLLELNR